MNSLGRVSRVSIAVLAAVGVGAFGAAGAEALPVVGVTSTAPQSTVVFDSDTPGTLTNPPTPVSGLATNELIVGIDYRPANASLYALARNTLTGAGRVYTLQPLTGVATAVGPSFGALPGTDFGVDFNPVSDRLRVTSDADINLRLTPDGALAATDTALAFAGGDTNAGDNPQATAIAYTNNTPGATTTTLYDLEFFNEILTTQNPPNNGTLNTVGTLLLSDALGLAGFDISETGGVPLLSVTSPSLPTISYLYGVSLATGSASSVGQIGPNGTGRVPSISISPQARVSAADTAVAEDAGTATITVDRVVPLGTSTVNYTTADGTATAGSDYTATSGTLTFDQGQRTKTVTVPVADDASIEGAADQTFRLVLSAPDANSRITDTDATVAIVDNDVAAAPAPTPEDAPPTVTLAPPGTRSALAPGQLGATATDDKGVARVVFMRGARVIGTATAAPFAVAYTPPVADIGPGSILAIAFDGAGQSATSIADVRVDRMASSLSAKTTPARDRSNPRVFTTRGALTLPAGADPKAACAGGRVKVAFTAGKATVASRTVKLTAACAFRSRVSFRLPRRLAASKKLAVTASFLGTAQVVSAKAKKGSVRLR